mmetsp:Transcript_14126/g.23188  ORF Transcript_14126/g.23188 Transcript_14126/m.23188 type:complete len:841 (+) Transcript_14126:122-2644(+)
MSQRGNMRRYLRQETSGDTSLQVGEFTFTVDGKAFIAYDNGCKQVWSNDDPDENPELFRWDCPAGVDPPADTDGGDRGLDDDYNGDVDDDGNDDDDYDDTLIYECTQRKLCNQSSPTETDPSATGWEFKGVCDFEGSVCPFPKYDESKDYNRGDEVAVNVDKLLHECINSNKCNENVPGASSGGANVNGGDDGWKLFGGCEGGDNCNVKEFDTSKATSDEYNDGDQVFTKIGRKYGTIGSTGGSGGGGGFGEASEGNTGGSGGGGGFGDASEGDAGGSGGGGFGEASEGNTGGASGSGKFGEGEGNTGEGSGSGTGEQGSENNDGFKLIYQCNNKEKCNSTIPSGPSAEGWALVGTCSANKVCAPQFADTDEYNLGDKASVPVDRLLHRCVDNSTCNDNVPGAEGWELIGGCKAGRICNAVEFDTSKAANEEYNNGDEVFTIIGFDYGTISSTGAGEENTAGRENDDAIVSIYCPASQGVDGSDKGTKTLITYAYEVETTQVTDASTFLPRLEGEITSNLASSMLSWCLKDARLRRRLGQYGVSGIESFPVDVPVPGGLCTYDSAAADGCFVIDGGITLSLSPGVNAEAAADAMRVLLEEAMTSDALLNPSVPEVVKVKYLGESYDDYVENVPGGASGAGATGLPENDLTGTETQGKKIGLAIALSAVAVLSLLLLALCCLKRRMSKGSKSELDTHGEDSELEDDLDDVIDRIGGIGNEPQTTLAHDPPGSFHMGKRHYTVDGVSYKSLSCAQCQGVKATTGILGRMSTTQEEVNDLDLNDKNDLSFDLDLATNFLDFSRNDLGRCHSSMNVRHCKSATCTICKKAGGIVFVKPHNEVEL